MVSPHPPSGLIVPIPRSIQPPTDLDEIVHLYKTLRLEGLSVDPASFSSTFERESQFDHETWRSRVVNPIGRTFVAVNSNAQEKTEIEDIEDNKSAIRLLLQKQWLGIITVLGPVLFSEMSDNTSTALSEKPTLHTAFIKDKCYDVRMDAANADFNGAHAAFMIVGLFVLPQARRRGFASRLIEATMKYVREEAQRRQANKASIAIQVAPTNAQAQSLYERLGFHVTDEAIVLTSQRGGEEEVVGLEKEIQLESGSFY